MSFSASILTGSCAALLAFGFSGSQGEVRLGLQAGFYNHQDIDMSAFVALTGFVFPEEALVIAGRFYLPIRTWRCFL